MSVLVIGEALVDVVHHADGQTAEHAGGSPANVAVALARLGATVRIATAYADDRLGALLDRYFGDAGVGRAGDPHVLSSTSTAAATLDAHGAATYVFDLHGELPEPEPAGDTLLLHTGSIGAVLQPGAAVVRAAVERLRGRATISYDLNARPAATGLDDALRATVLGLVALSDVVKASDEDLEILWPGRSVDDSVEALLSAGAGAVVVTRGRDGATCHTRVGTATVPGVTVRVADTIGAGDSFCAATLDGLRRKDLLGGHRREDLRALSPDGWGEVLARANRAAAITVSRPGADTPTAAELD